MKTLLDEIKRCVVCEAALPHGVNPVVSASSQSKFIIIGQAPGSIVHKSGIPWEDKSGDRLREWLGVDSEAFYNPNNFAIIPMGFCYPGKGKSGDLPPRKECAPLWHNRLLQMINGKQLTFLIGSYAQAYYLGSRRKNNLTETVRSFKDYLPDFIPLPHPSPRNNIWLKKNDWFESDILPFLRSTISANLST